MVSFKDIDRLSPFIKAFRPMLAKQLDSHVEQVYNEMVNNWESGRDAQGRPWEPNAPSTLEQKEGSTPLIETRQMIENSGYETDGSSLQAEIYIEDDPGKVLAHENGIPEQGIPARPILGPTQALLAEEGTSLIRQAFDRGYAQASRNGTSTAIDFSRKSAGGGL